ncbi:MAG: glutamine amidotransferase [Polyangiaceae bacterium]
MGRLAVLITGAPLPHTQQRRGGFPELIREQARGAWQDEWLDVDLLHDAALPLPRDLAGVIVTGSAAHLTDQEPWMLRGLEWLRSLTDAGTPVLGICFGHQMLGEALGGRVDRNPRGREIGSVQVRVSAPHPLLPERQLMANMTHLDSIVELPPRAKVLATTDLEPFAAVEFAPRVWGVQFHPEVDGEVMRDYISARMAALGQEGLNGEQILADAKDTPESAAVIERFCAALT